MFGSSHVHVTVPQNYNQIKTIFLAAKCGRLKDVESMIKLNPLLINSLDQYGNTALYYACLCGHDVVVEFLCNAGARDDRFGRCYLSALVRSICSIFLFLRICIFAAF